MRALLWIGAALAMLASILILWIALHGHIEHQHLDLFHLIAALAAATISVLLLRRALARRQA